MITNNTSGKRTHQKGQAMLELALTLPIFLTLLVGVFEVARLFFYNVSVNNATREAARYAASSGQCFITEGCTGTNGVLLYRDCTGIVNKAISSSPGIGLTADEITISYDHGATGPNVPDDVIHFDPPAICSSLTQSLVTGDRVVITIEKEFNFIVPIPGLNDFTITNISYRTILLQVE
ncbi:MAG TPA: TadE family protein [Candidatus Limnocylindrales bacterium]|nr:TadE family protein [Candidatus Limnocylindrales bacterium]